jgi:hypothetical protein
LAPPAIGQMQVNIIADGVRRHSINVSQVPQRLPGGFSARTWEVEVAASLTITQVVIGKTLADIQATP